MKKVLIETRMNALRLAEGKTPKKGCLGRLEGVCADFKNPTRNGRLYTRGLWEKVFNDNLFKESLQNKTLFGELDHPADRFEPLISEACVVMTDYTFDDDTGTIRAGFDILDTPRGRILKSILDYGSVVGVSSRGQGDIVETANGESVDEDTYEFACFDVVATPAVEKARQNVMESIKRIKSKSVMESIQQQINEAESVADLNIIRSVVRTSELSDSEMNSLVESIEDRCQAVQKADETIMASNDTDNAVQTTIESANTIRDNKPLYAAMSDLRKKLSAYKHREQRYIESLKARDSKISELSESIRSLKESNRLQSTKAKTISESLDRQVSEAKTNAETYQRKLSRSTEDNRRYRIENAELSRRLEESASKVRKLESEVRHESRKNEELQELLDKYSAQATSLKERLSAVREQADADNQDASNEIDSYTKLLDTANDALLSTENTIRGLREDLQTRDNQITKLREACGAAKKSLQSYQLSYATKLASINGIDVATIKESINPQMTPKQIEDLVKRQRANIDRHRKLGITGDSINGGNFIVESSRVVQPEDEEMKRLESFMDKVTEAL